MIHRPSNHNASNPKLHLPHRLQTVVTLLVSSRAVSSLALVGVVLMLHDRGADVLLHH